MSDAPASGLVVGRLALSALNIPFRTAFRHSSAERDATSTAWVEAHPPSLVEDPPRATADKPAHPAQTGYGESCPRPYVTGETLQSVRAFVDRHEGSLLAAIVDLDSVERWMAAHRTDIDENPAAWCAVELAVLDLLAKQRAVTIEDLLSLPPLGGRFQYTAVVGDSDEATFRASVGRYLEQGFTDFKIKLSGDLARDRSKVAAFAAAADRTIRVRVDANNLWDSSEQATAFLRDLNLPLAGIEEPIRANRYDELLRIAEALDTRIILDESLLRVDQLQRLPGDPRRWLINLRVSKMGGLLRSLAIVEAAREARIGLIVGAQVGETSLLTRAALTVANASRDILVAQEGAFGTHLLQRDICDPPLMFGAGGVLAVADFPQLRLPGLGLTPSV